MVAVLRKVYGRCMIPAKKCAVLERLAMVEGRECVLSMDSTLVIKNSYTYCKNLQVIKTKYSTHAPRGRVGRS